MKPTPVTRLFAKVDCDTSNETAHRSAPNPLLSRSHEYATSVPQRSVPLFVRDGASRETRSDAPRRPVFARALERPQPPAYPTPFQSRQADLSAELEQAYERGREDGRQLERLESERRAAADLAVQRDRAILERVEFQLNEYAKFGSAISTALDDLHQQISTSVARLLSPIVEERVANTAVAALAMTLRHLVSDRSAGLIRIRGPERLIAKLRDNLEPYAVNFEYTVEDRLDVTVEADDTIIETQLARWSQILRSDQEP